MNPNFNFSLAEGYTSNSQIARKLTEGWVGENVYCTSCGCDKLNNLPNNSPVADFICPDCSAQFELKSKKDSFTMKIVDGAYSTMLQRINSEDNPHFFFLNYSKRDLKVYNFIVIPKYYFFSEIIEQRKPLSPNAKRCGWVGCNILLKSIPESGKIFYIKDEKVVNKNEVLKTWSRTSFLAEQKKETRGWLIKIIKILDRISGSTFTLEDVYKYEEELKIKFPNNNFIKDKIRQQLQLIRDKGLIEFSGRGHYSKIK